MVQIGFIKKKSDNLFNYCSNLGCDGDIAVTFKETFPKQRIQDVGLRYCYCVSINNDLSDIKNEYVYNAYKVDENNLRDFHRKDLPGMGFDLLLYYIELASHLLRNR